MHTEALREARVVAWDHAWACAVNWVTGDWFAVASDTDTSRLALLVYLASEIGENRLSGIQAEAERRVRLELAADARLRLGEDVIAEWLGPAGTDATGGRGPVSAPHRPRGKLRSPTKRSSGSTPATQVQRAVAAVWKERYAPTGRPAVTPPLPEDQS